MRVTAVARAPKHTIGKRPDAAIVLLAGLGVEGDAHAGQRVQHRWDKRRDPSRPNERQVHVIGEELFAELAAAGMAVAPGDLGENIVTSGVDLTALPKFARLRIGSSAVIEVRGLREPCAMIDRVQTGLRAAVTADVHGKAAVRHGVMGVVLSGGEVRAGDAVAIDFSAAPHQHLAPV